MPLSTSGRHVGGGMAPLILNLGTGWWCAVPGRFTARLPIELEAYWAPEPVCAFCRREKFLASVGNRTHIVQCSKTKSHDDVEHCYEETDRPLDGTQTASTPLSANTQNVNQGLRMPTRNHIVGKRGGQKSEQQIVYVTTGNKTYVRVTISPTFGVAYRKLLHRHRLRSWFKTNLFIGTIA